MEGPLRRLDELLPPHVRCVAERETPIPTIAERAGEAVARGTGLVRCDIGQIVGVRPELEVLYGAPVGLPELRGAIAELYNRSFGLDAPLGREHVAVTGGAAEGLSLLFRCFAHGRHVGLPRGHWENYQNGVDLASGTAHVVEFFDDAGVLAPERIAAQIRARDLRVLVTNFPCNPTGVCLDGDETRALAAVVRETGVVAIADEVYARLRYDGARAETLIAYAPDHAVSVGSASKEYLLPGARVGYVVSHHADLTDRILRRLIRANTASPNVLGQRALLERLRPDLDDMKAGRDPQLMGAIRRRMHERLDALLAVLRQHDMAPAGRPPRGTIFLMASLPGWWAGDDRSFCEAALSGGYVSAIPGAAFGLPGSIRLSFGTLSVDDIARLDERLAAMRADVERA